MDFILIKWKIEDANDVSHYANNINIARNLRDAFPFPYTLKDATDYSKSCISGVEREKICRAIVVDNRVVGSIGVFLGSDVYSKSAELGYWLAEEYWGRGIMCDAVKLISQEAFQQLDIVRIFAEPFANNIGSRKVLERAGFSLEGIMKYGVVKHGEIHDYCMYALLK
jgi:ribosomal-protein-alanine N-acetyltransferase